MNIEASITASVTVAIHNAVSVLEHRCPPALQYGSPSARFLWYKTLWFIFIIIVRKTQIGYKYIIGLSDPYVLLVPSRDGRAAYACLCSSRFKRLVQSVKLATSELLYRFLDVGPAHFIWRDAGNAYHERCTCNPPLAIITAGGPLAPWPWLVRSLAPSTLQTRDD